MSIKVDLINNLGSNWTADGTGGWRSGLSVVVHVQCFGCFDRLVAENFSNAGINAFVSSFMQV
jgi:hypothetical protein